MSLTLQSKLRLINGGEIPVLGLGVFRAGSGGETQRAVRDALAAGYRHIDTAKIYGNESDVGAALRESGIARDELFVTTKLWNSDHGYDNALRACDASLARLGLERVDLYLLHWPVPKLRLDSWRALVALQTSGKASAIGVSNFMPRHVQEILDAGLPAPAVNQVEFSPFLFQRELLDFCTRNQIVVEAYSPLTKGQRLRHPVLVEVGARYRKSPAQVLIRWCLQHGMVVLPKSVHAERIRENAAVFDFDISDADMRILDGLNEDLHTGWDPTHEA